MTKETQDRITALRDNTLDSIPAGQRETARMFGAALAELFQLAFSLGLDLKHQAQIFRTFAVQTELEAADPLTDEQHNIHPPAYSATA